MEALVDGVFAIVMTILVLEIRLPDTEGVLSNTELWHELVTLTPDFLSFFASFTVLAMYWTTHHAFYNYFIKTVNRIIVQLNLLYLCFLSFLPFSAHLVANHFDTPLACTIYGLNMLAISGIQIVQFYYALEAHEVEVDDTELDRRTYAQVVIRLYLTPVFTLLGMIAAFFSPHTALFLFAFPIIFNLLPGTLNFVERVLHIKLPPEALPDEVVG